MKNLKLSLLALVSVISFGSLSQSFVSTSNTTSAGTCDGTALFDTTILNINILTWNNQGVAIQYGGYSIDSLCSGTYSVTYIDTTNSIATTIFTIGTSCVNFYAAIIPIDSTLYNGSMTVYTVNGTAPYTYQWDNGVMLQTINNLSAGVYCCYVMDANGCTDSLCDIIGTQSTNFGDTLVLNSIGTCNSPASTFTTTIEDCTINFNTIDTAYMTIDSFINSGLDSILCVWYVIDTTGTYQTYMVNYPMIDSTGCYNFQLTVYCYNKTSGYKTIIINQTENVGFANINELSMNKRKLIKVIDMMGNETKLESNRFLIKCYDDGTTEKVFQTNK
jgi:hypothetical protein